MLIQLCSKRSFVIAVSHEKWGNAVCIRRCSTRAYEEELITFSREKLAHFKA